MISLKMKEIYLQQRTQTPGTKIVSDSKMYVKETWDCYLQKGNEHKRIS